MDSKIFLFYLVLLFCLSTQTLGAEETFFNEAKTKSVYEHYRNDLTVLKSRIDEDRYNRIASFFDLLIKGDIRKALDFGVFDISSDRWDIEVDEKWRLIDIRINNAFIASKSIIYFDYVSMEKVGEEMFEGEGIMIWKYIQEEWVFVSYPFRRSGFSISWPADFVPVLDKYKKIKF